MKKRLLAVFVLGLLAVSACADEIATITAEALHKNLEAKSDHPPLVVDVREPAEFEASHIDGALLAPLATVEENLAQIPKDREIVLVCRSGRRSGLAYQRLAARGYTRLWNMTGGMIAWEKLGYPVVKK